MTPDELRDTWTEHTPGPECLVSDPALAGEPPRIRGFSLPEHPVTVFRYFPPEPECEHPVTEHGLLVQRDAGGRVRGTAEVQVCTSCRQPVSPSPAPLLWEGDQA